MQNNVEPHPALNDHEFECLALLYLDGLANEDQQAQLASILTQDNTAAARMMSIADMHAQLCELGKSHADQPLSVTASVNSTGTSRYNKKRITTRRIGFPKRKSTLPLRRYVIAASLLFAAGILALVVSFQQQPSDHLSITNGTLAITRHGQTSITDKPFTLEPGDQLTTNGASVATITTADGSSITITPHSNVIWRTKKSPMRVITGSVVAQIKPQPVNYPFKAETKQARITVIGTRFTLTADEIISVLNVDHGRVRLENQHDQQVIDVAEHQLAGTTGAGVMQTVAAPAFTATTYGLTGDYFNNSDFTEWRFRRIDENINFDWLQGSPDTQIDPESFSVRWRGYIIPPTSGTYTFQVEVDDGVRLWIGDNLLIDKWILTSRASFTSTINLSSEHLYPIRLDYFQEPVDTLVKLSWAIPGQPLVPVPPSAFRPMTWSPQ